MSQFISVMGEHLVTESIVSNLKPRHQTKKSLVINNTNVVYLPSNHVESTSFRLINVVKQ